MRLMESPADFTGPVNLGNPAEFTMRELAELVLVETQSLIASCHAAFAPRRSQAAPARHFDRGGTVLGWVPKISLREGLKATVEYFLFSHRLDR